MSDSKSPKDNGGPLVKTGPNAGQVRSRNDDGRWREKRSDAGKPRERKSKESEKKGCFLTTAACEYRGLPDDCFELSTMRSFRDRVLLETCAGQAMVQHYYEIAPRLVPFVDDEMTAQWVWGRIQETVGHITGQRNEAAIASYKDLVDGLTRRAELAQDR